MSTGTDTAKVKTCVQNHTEINITVEQYFMNTGLWPANDLSDIGTNPSYFPDVLPTCPESATPHRIDPTTHRVIGHAGDSIINHLWRRGAASSLARSRATAEVGRGYAATANFVSNLVATNPCSACKTPGGAGGCKSFALRAQRRVRRRTWWGLDEGSQVRRGAR